MKRNDREYIRRHSTASWHPNRPVPTVAECMTQLTHTIDRFSITLMEVSTAFRLFGKAVGGLK